MVTRMRYRTAPKKAAPGVPTWLEDSSKELSIGEHRSIRLTCDGGSGSGAWHDPVLDSRSGTDCRGRYRGRRLPQLPGTGAACGAMGVQAVLVGRTSQHAGHCQ